MKLSNRLDLQKVTNLLIFVISLIPLILFLYVVSNRIDFAYNIEWGEGAGINQINRILSRQTLYGKPTLQFSPLVYTPFYYYLTAFFALVIKNVLFSARLISTLATIGSAGLIFSFVKRETENLLVAFAAGTFYLACFALGDGFFDLVRVDSLYIFIVLGTFGVMRSAKGFWGYSAAGLLLAIGFFTKQSALIIFFPLIFFFFLKKIKYTWPLLVTAGLGIGLPLITWNFITKGWFFYYIFDLPKEHGYSILSAVNFWVGDTLGPLGIAIGFSLIYLVANKQELGANKKEILVLQEKEEYLSGSSNRMESNANQRIIYLLFTVGAIGAAWITRSSNGGGANNCMSAYASIALLFGLGIERTMEFIRGQVSQGRNFQFVIAILISVQFIGLIFNPFNFIPTSSDLQKNDDLKQEIKLVEGQVFIPYRSHLSEEVGKEAQIHIVNLFELTGYFKGDIQPVGNELVNLVRTKICNQEYAMIIYDQPVPWFSKQIDYAYLIDDDYMLSDKVPWSPVQSWQANIDRIYIPKEANNVKKCLASIPDSNY